MDKKITNPGESGAFLAAMGEAGRPAEAQERTPPGEGQETFESIYNMLDAWVRDLGLSHFMFRLSLNPAGDSPNVVLIHNYPERWTQFYRSKLHYRIDPIVRHCREATSPIFWDEVRRPDNVSQADYTQFLREAILADLVNGVSFPLHGPIGEWGLLNLNGPVPLSRTHPEAGRICTMGKIFSAYLQDATRQIIRNQASKLGYNNLTERQKECLLWTIEGKTAWEVSRILGISERTVVYHIQNCFDVLNVNNRTQAAARAYSYLQADLGFLNENGGRKAGILEYKGTG
ncbi:LuxR family transcriptional regulator [Sphingobium sufflavum]|uniref:helix-turn-helix transcriptional regulator n=1 Tax=Sphingobium sufflavum TaxID=1129547 RepID=UPI001F253330|nr:LuxR family transcriptional regulator [Sphingobium sufflavum]MCE7797245.1 LuxR family transcriptional regulator [Sphingobium sufflavum]